MQNRGHFLKSLALSAPLALVAAFAAQAGGYSAPVIETAVAPVIEITPEVGDWQGAYGGITLGYAFRGKDRVGLAEGTGSVTNYDTLELSGANAGIRVGYRWQKDNWVFGPELGFEGGNIKDSFDNDEGYDASSKIKNVAALRLKTGYVVRPDMLVYGIAGVARAKVDYSVEGTGAQGVADIDDTYSKTGYIVGLGVEKKLTERMSVTGEYEYANFGKETLVGASGLDTEATAKYNNIKVGLNFRF